jgi:hypothetical protein
MHHLYPERQIRTVFGNSDQRLLIEEMDHILDKDEIISHLIFISHGKIWITHKKNKYESFYHTGIEFANIDERFLFKCSGTFEEASELCDAERLFDGIKGRFTSDSRILVSGLHHLYVEEPDHEFRALGNNIGSATLAKQELGMFHRLFGQTKGALVVLQKATGINGSNSIENELIENAFASAHTTSKRALRIESERQAFNVAFEAAIIVSIAFSLVSTNTQPNFLRSAEYRTEVIDSLFKCVIGVGTFALSLLAFYPVEPVNNDFRQGYIGYLNQQKDPTSGLVEPLYLHFSLTSDYGKNN